MKKSKWLIIGVVGVLAYMYYKKRQKTNAQSNTDNVKTIEEVVDTKEENVNDNFLS
jgi:predicted negative regulator of RcsB-dependent stress response